VDVRIPNDFKPRFYQRGFMRALDAGVKRLFWVMHRRAGKDLTAMHQTCKMMHKRKGVYWHVFPSFAQGRKAIWEGFTKDGKRIMENVFPGFTNPKRVGSIVKRKDEQQMMIELKCGSVWRLIGSDRIEIVGAGPVGVVFSEFALSNPKAWNMIRPMLRENDGWAAFITTPRGNNHAKDQFDIARSDPAWFCEVRTVYDTKLMYPSDVKPGTVIDADAMMDEERAAGMPEPLINQEYKCDWSAALVGSIWGELIDSALHAGAGKPFNHPYDSVFTTWDLGLTDNTAVWFWQAIDGGVDLIDFYSDRGRPLSHYFAMLENKPFTYVKHWLPHDARQTTLASGVSVLSQFMQRYPGQVAIQPKMPLVEGIHAARWLIQQGVRFHPRCAEGIEALRFYHYEYDEEKKIFATSPVHDWSSHPADAFRGVASVVKQSALLVQKEEGSGKKATKDVGRPLSYSTNLEELFEDHKQRLMQRRRI
jgi:phage terminase large subunit